jgi:hypothetical protein
VALCGSGEGSGPAAPATVSRVRARPGRAGRCREHATGAADADGRAGGDDLPDQEQEKKSEDVAAGDGGAEDRVADAVHLRQAQQQPAEDQATDGGAQPAGSAPQSVAQVLDEVRRTDAHTAPEG